MLAKSGRRLPFITTLHGTDITLVGLDRSYLPITRHAILESDGVTSHLRLPAQRNHHQDFDVARPIQTIPNFVNCDVYKPITKSAAQPGAQALCTEPAKPC